MNMPLGIMSFEYCICMCCVCMGMVAYTLNKRDVVYLIWCFWEQFLLSVDSNLPN